MGESADRQAEFLKHFLTHQDDIRAVIGSLVRDRTACDDVFQETALVLWRRFEQYDPARSFGAWARGIAVHKAFHHFDRTRRAPAPLDPGVIERVLEVYDRTEDDGEALRAALQTCLRKLPERSRHLLELRYGQALKLREMAVQLGRKLDAVHKAVSRLRDRLRACIEREMIASGEWQEAG